MPITPNPKAMQLTSLVMAKTLQCLHEIIEKECDHKRPKEAMVLMMAFTTGLILQLKDKVETLEQGLGNELLAAINEITKEDPANREIVEKLNKKDPSLNESASGISPDDFRGAVEFLANRFLDGIQKHFNELPVLLRNETTLLHGISVLVARLFNKLDDENLETHIETFSNNVRIFAGKKEQGGAFDEPKRH
jgi:hypothetical protein